MSLIITNYGNFFKVKGVLEKDSIDLFKEEFIHVFEKYSSIILSLEGIETIDKYGIKSLVELHNESIKKNKKLSIIGLGCKDLYDHFKTEIAA